MIICAFMPRILCVRKTLCPDFRAFKIACVQTFVRSTGKLVRSKVGNLCVYIQTIVRSKVLMSRLSCVQSCLCPDFNAIQRKIRALQNWYFVRSCPDYRAFEWPYMQTFVRSNVPMSKLVRSKGKLVRSKTDNLCVHVQTIVRSNDLICRLSCVQNCLCPDFHAFQRKIRALQNWYFVRSCPDYCAFEWPYMQNFVRSKLPMSKL